MNELRLRTQELSWREIDGELVAVDVARSAYLSSNPAGTLLWQMLAGGTTRDALEQALVETFGDRRSSRAKGDVASFLDDLSSLGSCLGGDRALPRPSHPSGRLVDARRAAAGSAPTCAHAVSATDRRLRRHASRAMRDAGSSPSSGVGRARASSVHLSSSGGKRHMARAAT